MRTIKLLRFAFLAIGSMSIVTAQAQAFTVESNRGSKLKAEEIAKFNAPWAMTFVNEKQILVTTKPGKLWLVSTDGKKTPVSGLPKPAVRGQGGLGDVVLHPGFAENKQIYVSMVESLDGGKTRGAIVLRGKLNLEGAPKITELEKLWTQSPKARSSGHFSHRIAFGPEGSEHAGKLLITSGDRQEQTPAQDFGKALGKLIRLNDDGTVPSDNPFQNKGKLAKTYWTTGHRNMLGIAFDGEGRLWSHEMGPAHGDELNLIVKGKNYGWPVVSEGNNYNGRKIPSHNTRPEFEPPKAFWVPSIAPSGLIIYSGKMFPDWQGDAFIGGLVSQALIHVDLQGDKAKEFERFEWNQRIREVEQGPKGALWVLEDGRSARLLKLTHR